MRFGEIFRGKPKESDAQPQPARVEEKSSEFIERLRRGEYIQPLESYGVKWSLEKVARDVLQNFSDSQGYTLDGVKFDMRKSGEGDESEWTLRISGDADYDFRPLLHIGGTTKEEDIKAGGGFGEGAKIAVLVMLRDFGFTDIKFGSRDWELSYYLDDVPEESYHKKARGLHAKVAQTTHKKGNFVEFKSSDGINIQQFITTRELFYHHENEDFKPPIYENENGGFKVLVPEGDKTTLGHFYHVGQRRHFDKPDAWNTVEYVNIWTRKKCLPPDRDRGVITRTEMKDNVIPLIIEPMTGEEAKKTIYSLEPIWSEGLWYQVGPELLSAICRKAKEGSLKLEFPLKYIARTGFTPLYISEAMKKAGYEICHSCLSEVGMQTVAEKFKELQGHFKEEPRPQEEQRIAILSEVAKLLGVDQKEVWLFSAENEKNIFQGQYDEAFIWMSGGKIGGEFEEALSIYIHEVTHKEGTDQSAEFSYALTDSLQRVIKAMAENPEKFKDLKERWDSIKNPPKEVPGQK